MQPETDGGDYISAFARRYRIDAIELRACIHHGPRFVRNYLEECGIYDAYPRRAASERENDVA